MPQEKKLTIKQARWLDAYIQTGNATEAAMQAYDCADRAVAAHIGYENVIKLEAHELMEKMGMTDFKLYSKLDELIEAKKTVSAVSGKDANAGTVDFVDVPDYQTQVKALDIALKLKARYPREGNTTNIQVNNVIPILGGSTAVQGDNSDTQDITAQEEN